MELTGIKTPLGMKVQGPNVDGIEQAAVQIQAVLSGIPQVRSVFTERVSQGFYIDVEPDRAEAARYGLTIEDIQRAVASELAGKTSQKMLKDASVTPSMCDMSGISAIRHSGCSAY